MRDIRTDLRERLEATLKQRIELEARERCLRALLRDEEVIGLNKITTASSPACSEATNGNRLREFILQALKDGQDHSLDDLKGQAYGVGLRTVGASGRSLNITLVNLLREGLVIRLRNGRWRLGAQAAQLPLDFVYPGTDLG
jgi:hypothetical protein